MTSVRVGSNALFYEGERRRPRTTSLEVCISKKVAGRSTGPRSPGLGPPLQIASRPAGAQLPHISAPFCISLPHLSICLTARPLPPTQPLKTTSPAKLHYDFARSEFRRFVSGLQRTLLLVQKPKSLSDLNIIHIENILPYCPKTLHISVKIHKSYHY